jgi:hypothetical protein
MFYLASIALLSITTQLWEKKGAEVFFFGDDSKAIASIAHYDEL